jgi:hypothetical protein
MQWSPQLTNLNPCWYRTLTILPHPNPSSAACVPGLKNPSQSLCDSTGSQDLVVSDYACNDGYYVSGPPTYCTRMYPSLTVLTARVEYISILPSAACVKGLADPAQGTCNAKSGDNATVTTANYTCSDNFFKAPAPAFCTGMSYTSRSVMC